MTEEKISKIGNALLTSVKKDCKSDVSISFSGGIDSTLVALLAKKYTNVELIAVGIKDSHDIEAAKSAAKLIDLTLNVKEINEDELLSEALILQKKLNLTQFQVEFMLPFWIAAKNAKNPVLMCGQGADEVFGGYARFREAKNIPNLSKETEALLEIIPKREKKIAEIFGVELSCPYLSNEVIEASKVYSQEEHIGTHGKEKLREAALELGLPEKIANRKKKAAQYGSGSQKILKKKIKYEIRFKMNFESEKIAQSIKKATDPENEGWVESSVEGNIMKAKVKAANMGSLRLAAEDFMSCVSVAENILKK